MGVSYNEMLDLSWQQFEYYSSGYQRRLERELNNTRIIVSSFVNLWSKKKIRPEDLMQLSIDKVNYEREILTAEQCNEILSKWES